VVGIYSCQQAFHHFHHFLLLHFRRMVFLLLASGVCTFVDTSDTSCTMLGVLARFCPIIVQVTPLKTPFGLVTPFSTIPITRSCNHTQLLLTPLHNYNPCAFMPTVTYCTVTLLTINSLCCRSSILRLDSTRSSLANY
jgi:hypothetical protein